MSTAVDLLRIITLNAETVPDPRTEGLTDVALVSLEDIESIEGAIAVSVAERKALLDTIRGLVGIFDSVTQGQERERRDHWLPAARALLRREES